MSDLSIPGVKSKYDTQKMIEELMKLERVPKTRAETELKAMEKERSVWMDVNVRMSKLRDSCKNLYSYKNPFQEHIATSSDEDSLTATATREAIVEKKKIDVVQVASADRFLSGNMPKDKKVPEGSYTFTVGDQSTTVKFSGGTLKDFAEAINRRGKDLVRAQVVGVDKDTQAILIESLKTGSKNRLGFKDAAERFALDAGMMEKSLSSERSFRPAASPSASSPTAPSGTTEAAASDATANGTAPLAAPGGYVAAGKNMTIPFSPPLKGGGNLILEYQYRTVNRGSGDTAALPATPTGPTIPATGSMSYGGITIQSENTELDLPPFEAPPPPKHVDDFNPFSLSSAGPGTAASLPAISDQKGFVTVQVRLADLPGDYSGFTVKNANTDRDIEIGMVRVYDPTERGGTKPKNAISSSMDAIVKMDGIEVKREKNDIDDLIPGVTLHLHKESEKTVRLSVDPDAKAAKDAVIQWIGYYNQLVTEANILIKKDETVVKELDYLDETEKKSAMERLGLFQGDFTLQSVKSAMQRTSSGSYQTRLGPELSLLSQIGISTNQRVGGGAGYDPSKLRGYLEVDESALDEALKSKSEAVKELFGNDTDGDLAVDSGIAWAIDSLMKPYVETGGIMAMKQSTIKSKMDRQKTKIEDLDKQLARKEQELKTKYGMMESTLNRLESTSSSIDNFGKSGGN